MHCWKEKKLWSEAIGRPLNDTLHHPCSQQRTLTPTLAPSPCPSNGLKTIHVECCIEGSLWMVMKKKCEMTSKTRKEETQDKTHLPTVRTTLRQYTHREGLQSTT